MVMFNLGYLPRGDKACTTAAHTTLRALEAALAGLKPGGIITVMAYTGHDGGMQEAMAVRQWCDDLARDRYLYRLSIRDSDNRPPHCMLIQRL